MSELAAEFLPGTPVAVLSGPSFAAEVARDLPTAVTIASHDPALAEPFMAALGSARFRPYLSEDPIGVEIGGAVKNVLAIACGIVDGRRLGDNARAALITRGLAEMIRLGVAKGARAGNLSRALGARRSGADLQRRAVAQPRARSRARSGAEPRRRARRTPLGRRRRRHRRRRDRAGGSARGRDADQPRRSRPCCIAAMAIDRMIERLLSPAAIAAE